LSEAEKEAWEARGGQGSRPSWNFLAGSKDAPAARRELRDVMPLEPGASFGFSPPDGLPVRDAETPREQSPWERWARSTGRPD
jgi:hypothetical protein